MKRLVLSGAIAAVLLSTMPVAAQAQAPAKDTKTQSAPDVKAFDKQLAETQVQMKQMQEQMDRMRLTQDPLERQKLMQDHYLAMQNAMKAMHGMWGPGMMGSHGMMHGPGMMGGDGMHGYYSTLTPEQMKQRQYMMEQYMGMQQMMMDQMMMRQQWMPTPPATK